MADTGAELPTPPQSVLENPRMQRLIEGIGIEPEDYHLLEKLDRVADFNDVFAGEGHNRFGIDHEATYLRDLERDARHFAAQVESERSSSYEWGKRRTQAAQQMCELFLPLGEKYGRVACFRILTFFEGREEEEARQRAKS